MRFLLPLGLLIFGSAPAHACFVPTYEVDNAARASESRPDAIHFRAKVLRGLVPKDTDYENGPIPFIAYEFELLEPFGSYNTGDVVRLVAGSTCTQIAHEDAIFGQAIDGFLEFKESSIPGYVVSKYSSYRNLELLTGSAGEAVWLELRLAK